MRGLWSNLSISKKMAVGFALVFILLLLLGLSNYFGLSTIGERSDLVLRTSDLIYDFDQREIDHLLWVLRLGELIDDNNADFDIQLDHTQCMLGQWIYSSARTDLEEYIPDLKETLLEFEREHQQLHESAQRIQAVLGTDHEQALLIYRNETKPTLDSIRVIFNQIAQSLHTFRTEIEADIANVLETNLLFSMILPIVAVVVGSVMAFLITRRIVFPIKLLTNALHETSMGDLRVAIDYTANDETGIMIKSFNKMLTNLNEIITASKVATTETVAASQNSSAAVEELSASIEQVATSATHFATSATLISEQTQNINLEAQKTGELAQTGSERIESCMESMLMIEQASDLTSDAMEGLRNASDQIVKVVQVVTDIADQTNLLSLNAAIEAARAGEYGHGFAVVADEVRKLAEQTKSSLQEVNHLVANLDSEMNSAIKSTNTSRTKVRQGTEVVKETTVSLQTIVKQISSIMVQLRTIADKTQEQAALSEEIAAMTEEQSAATSGIAESSVDLANIAQSLEDFIEKFSV